MSIEQLEKTLRLDVKPALGCTEPIAIALATCKACSVLSGEPSEIVLRLSTNLIKNALEVGIPNTGGEHGIALAAALGALCKDAQPDLTLLERIGADALAQAKALVGKEIIHIELAEKKHGLYMDIIVLDQAGNKGRCVISGTHENVVLLEQNDVSLFAVDSVESPDSKVSDRVAVSRKQLSESSFAEIWANIGSLSAELREHLLSGVEMNLRVAAAGLDKEGLLHIGNVYQALIDEGWLGNDVINKAKALTSAAVDARMSGCNLPVMTSAGSGNQGLTIALPLHVLAEEIKADRQKLGEALAISHGITSILKHHSGTLSAMCGCVVCSGLGLACGVTYLLGGSIADATAAVNNMVGGVTGIICDGAKVGCTVKLTCAVDSAFQSAMMAIKGLKIPVSNGVIGQTMEQSLANVGLIASSGMYQTDDHILAIMLNKPQC